MKSYFRIILILIISAVFFSCSSTLHLYSGQRYFTDEELGTLTISEQIQVYKFDRQEVYKTKKPPVIKALPGKHELDLRASLSENEEDVIEKTVYWEAVEGHVYQLTISESKSDDVDVIIVDVTNSISLQN